MCIAAAAGAMAGGKISDAIFRPHRMFGLRGPLEFMFHPNDKYNRAKQEAAAKPADVEAPDQTAPTVPFEAILGQRRKLASKPAGSPNYGASTPLSVGGG